MKVSHNLKNILIQEFQDSFQLQLLMISKNFESISEATDAISAKCARSHSLGAARSNWLKEKNRLNCNGEMTFLRLDAKSVTLFGAFSGYRFLEPSSGKSFLNHSENFDT
jgi:hypothetical protein